MARDRLAKVRNDTSRVGTNRQEAGYVPVTGTGEGYHEDSVYREYSSEYGSGYGYAAPDADDADSK